MAVNVSMRNLLEPELADTVARLLVQAGLPAGAAQARGHRERDRLRPGARRARAGAAGRPRPARLGRRLRHRLLVADPAAQPAGARGEDRPRRSCGTWPSATDDRAIVRAVIGLGHDLGLRVVAEGVEDEASWRLLDELDCDLVQGYFLARPMPAEEMTTWLAEHFAAYATRLRTESDAGRRARAAGRRRLPGRPRRSAGSARSAPDGRLVWHALGSASWPSCASLSPRSTPSWATSTATPTRSSSWARHAADRGAHLVAFPEMVLTGYPVEDLALRRSFVDASRAALDDLAARLADEGLGELVVVVGYLDGAPDAVPVARARRRARRRTPPRCCTAAGSSRATPSTTCRTTASSTSSATSCPATADASSGCTASTSRSPICEDLWQDGGPVAGRREAGAGLLLVINGSPYERNKDDVRLELRPAPRRRGRAARSPTSTWSAARTSWSSTATRSSSPPTASCSRGRAQFDERAARRRPRPAGRDRGAPTTASDAPRRRPSHRARRRGRPSRRTSRQPRRSPTRLDDEAEVYGALVARRCATTSRKNGFRRCVLGLSGGIDSALTAAIACDAIGRGERLRRLDARAATPRSTPGPTPPTWRERTGLQLHDRADRADGRRLPRRARADRPGRGEPAGPGPRHDR